MRHAAWGALGAAALAVSPLRADAVSLTMSPATVRLDAAPGSTTTFTVRITNPDPVPVDVHAYAWDYWHGKEGRFFAPPGTTPRSLAGWLEVVPRATTVPAGETLEFLATVSIPPDAAGGYYATLFFQTGTEEGTVGMTATTAARLGAIVLLDVTGTATARLEVVDGGMRPQTETSPGMVAVNVRNPGDVHVEAELKAVLRTPEGEVLQSLASERPLSVLPGEQRSLEVPFVGEMAPGAYEIAGTVLYGDDGAVPVVIPVSYGGAVRSP